MAGSLLIAVGDVAGPLRERLLAAMDALRLADTSVDDAAGMGPLIDGAARDRVAATIGRAAAEARLLRDGRRDVPAQGFFVGPTLLDEVAPGSALFREEVFGPVLGMLTAPALDDAIRLMGRLGYGNGATIFTTSGRAARQFTREMPAGMLGVNVGVPAPMVLFPFAGWNDSFYGDLHMQGSEGVQFYTRQRVVLSRWDSGYRRSQGW
jgi:malonate-semialdehyde dehydrogenase (acetylating)/methylmalonate-semialdehyde dehydrogenase